MTKLFNEDYTFESGSTDGTDIVYLNGDSYEKCVQELELLAKTIEDSKRPGYTQANGDVLSNFRKAAIMSYAKDPSIPQAEDIEGRFADAMNYLKLGFYILKEKE